MVAENFLNVLNLVYNLMGKVAFRNWVTLWVNGGEWER